MKWKIRNNSVSLEKPLLMGVLNLTPDSFSDGGKFLNKEDALDRARRMIQEGADLLDLGAESTRPGAPTVSAKEELERLLPVLETLLSEETVPISIDTTKSEVARECLELGAHIINDVSGLKDSGQKMARVVRDFGAGIILMHRRGNSGNMQSFTNYQNVTVDVCRELRESIELALKEGIDQESIVIDLGIGFAKTAEQNIEMLREFDQFKALGFPTLVGASRKSFIGHITGREVHEREFGTAAVVALMAQAGVNIHRVHNIAAMRDVLKVVEAIHGNACVKMAGKEILNSKF